MRAALEAILAEAGPEELPDGYGQGPIITSFEQEIAELLGKPAAIFFPSGTMAQPLAMRLWAERARCPTIGFHPTSHLQLHENLAYQHVHHLEAALIGAPDRLMTVADLKAVQQPLSALLLELPQRELGGLLPEWDALCALVEAARARQTAVRLDGARLWESGPYYRRSYAEIAGVFDSVYVSFYKGLGGIAGAVLAGQTDFIADAKVWKRRLGGDLVAMYPYILAARRGLREQLPKMASCLNHTRALAEALSALEGVMVFPGTPQTPMMHVWLQAISVAALADAARAVSSYSGGWLFSGRQLRPTPRSAGWRVERTITPDSLAVAVEEGVRLIRTLLQRAQPLR